MIACPVKFLRDSTQVDTFMIGPSNQDTTVLYVNLDWWETLDPVEQGSQLHYMIQQTEGMRDANKRGRH